MNVKKSSRNIIISLALLLISGAFASIEAQPATAAGSAFVCGNDICDPKRRAYVGKSKRWACTISKALSRSINRLDALKRALQRELDAKARCLANNPRNPRSCNWRNRKIRILQRAINKQQAKLDKIFGRVQFQCNSSLPHPHIPNPNNCEQTEAAKYCPVSSPEDARNKTQKRCDDMKAEELNAQLICGAIACVKPNQLAHIEKSFPVLSSLAASVPQCATPTPTPTPETPTPTPTVAATATSIPTATVTIPPTATATPNELACSNPVPPTGGIDEVCGPTQLPDGNIKVLCCKSQLI